MSDSKGAAIITCTKCGLDKLPCEIGQKRCMSCYREYRRNRYQQNPEVRARHSVTVRRYNQSEAGKKAKARSEARNQDKILARKAVRSAVAWGRFFREPCAECGEAKVEFHHTDGYDEPHWFVGHWLCRNCHAQLHRLIREELSDDR